jgi:3-hydroxy-9,10-secoandrosta-1,3,5(10)-triene-9,17-dione monooxygenase
MQSRERRSAAEVIKRTEALISTLRERAILAEELREMPPASVAELKAAGTARLLQPARFGGSEAKLRSVVDALSAVGRGCGSTAWIMAQHVSHNYMLAHWPDAAQQTVWGEDPTQFLSGIFIPGCGRGRRVTGGYILSGRWPLVSGVNTCDWCLFSAHTEDGSGAEVDLHYALKKGQFEIIDTWRAMGLKGSSSNDVVVKEVFVPEQMTLSIEHLKGGPTPDNAHNSNPLYRIPSYAIFGTFIGGACLGIAESALEFHLERARERVALMSRQRIDGYATQHVKVADAASSIATARLMLVDICEHADEIAERAAVPSDEERAKFRAHAAFAGRLAMSAVNLLWDAGGGSGVYAENPISRVFRDMSAANRHFTQNWDVNASTYGRVLMGLDMDNPSL